MRAEWQAHWYKPPAHDHASAWLEQAAKAGIEKVETTEWEKPSAEDFIHVAAKATGSAGLDGWDSQEVKALAKFAPFICEEAHAFFCKLTESAASDR